LRNLTRYAVRFKSKKGSEDAYSVAVIEDYNVELAVIKARQKANCEDKEQFQLVGVSKECSFNPNW